MWCKCGHFNPFVEFCEVCGKELPHLKPGSRVFGVFIQVTFGGKVQPNPWLILFTIWQHDPREAVKQLIRGSSFYKHYTYYVGGFNPEDFDYEAKTISMVSWRKVTQGNEKGMIIVGPSWNDTPYDHVQAQAILGLNEGPRLVKLVADEQCFHVDSQGNYISKWR